MNPNSADVDAIVVTARVLPRTLKSSDPDIMGLALEEVGGTVKLRFMQAPADQWVAAEGVTIKLAMSVDKAVTDSYPRRPPPTWSP